MKTFLKVLRIIGMLLCLTGTVWFMLPLVRRGVGIGMFFGAGVCLMGFLLLYYYRRAKERSPRCKLFVRVLSGLYGLGIGWCVYLTVLLCTAASQAVPANADVLVLGSQVYSIEHLGVSLQNRVEAAGKYLLAHPEAKCIVTGGQGDNEPCTEAEAQRHALIRMGVEKERIFLEDKSKNTRENMNFAREVARENGVGETVAVVTQSFHMYRALKLAENAGFTPYALVAETDPLLFPLYYGRELLSLTKWQAERLILER